MLTKVQSDMMPILIVKFVFCETVIMKLIIVVNRQAQ